jgi:hypothetical protein
VSHFLFPSVLLLIGLLASVGVAVSSTIRRRAVAERSAPLSGGDGDRPGGAMLRQLIGRTAARGSVFAELPRRSATGGWNTARHSPIASAWYAFSLVLVVAVLISHSAILGDFAGRIAGDLAQALSALGAGALCFYADRRSRYREVPRLGSRSGWFFLALACIFWGAGQLLWTWLEIVQGKGVPFPSLADVGYLLALPCTTLALVTFKPTPTGAASRFRALFDSSIIALSLFGIAWSTVLGPFIFHADQPWLTRILSITYPLFDVLNWSIALGAIVRPGMRNIHSLVFVAVGLGFLTTADTMFLYLSEKDSYQTGSWTDLGWIFCYAAFGLGATYSRESMRPKESRVSITAWRAALPYGALGCAVLSAGLMWATAGAVSTFVFFDGIVILCLIALRQVTMIVENIDIEQSLERIALAVADETPLRKASEELRTISANFDRYGVSTEQAGELVERLWMVTRSTESYKNHVAKAVTDAVSVARRSLSDC